MYSVQFTVQVECFVVVKEPTPVTSAWIENGNAQIRVKSTANCILLSEFKLAWKHITLDNQINTLSETSAVLTLTNLSTKDLGQYYYEVLKKNSNIVIYTSSKVIKSYITCK